MQKYNYISEMGSNPPSYDPHRGIDLGTMPVPPPNSAAHSLAIDDKPSFSASFQPFSLPVSVSPFRDSQKQLLCLVLNYLMLLGKYHIFRTISTVLHPKQL